MIVPPPRSTIFGAIAAVSRNGALTLTANVSSKRRLGKLVGCPDYFEDRNDLVHAVIEESSTMKSRQGPNVFDNVGALEQWVEHCKVPSVKTRSVTQCARW
jgi:hypothetical protein